MLMKTLLFFNLLLFFKCISETRRVGAQSENRSNLYFNVPSLIKLAGRQKGFTPISLFIPLLSSCPPRFSFSVSDARRKLYRRPSVLLLCFISDIWPLISAALRQKWAIWGGLLLGPTSKNDSNIRPSFPNFTEVKKCELQHLGRRPTHGLTKLISCMSEEITCAVWRFLVSPTAWRFQTSYNSFGSKLGQTTWHCDHGAPASLLHHIGIGGDILRNEAKSVGQHIYNL